MSVIWVAEFDGGRARNGRGRYALAVMLAMIPLSGRANNRPQRLHPASPVAPAPLSTVPPPSAPAPTMSPPVGWPTLPADASPPTVVGNPGEFFGPDDYPPAAIRAEQEGRTVARRLIDASGTPQACVVERSSGSAELDDATCRIARLHLRFVPAHDAQGKALPGIYSLPVRWKLPEPDPLPRTSFSVAARAELTAEGIVTSCTTSNIGVIIRGSDGYICPEMRQDPEGNKRVIAPLGGKRATGWSQSAKTFDGDVAPAEEHKHAGRTLIGVARAHLTIAPDGTMAACEVIEETGQLGQGPICTGKPYRFVPDAPGTRSGATVLVAFSMAPATAPATPPANGARRGRPVRRRH